MSWQIILKPGKLRSPTCRCCRKTDRFYLLAFYSSKAVIDSTTKSASTVINHSYGSEARDLADNMGSSVKRTSELDEPDLTPTGANVPIGACTDVALVYIE